MATNPVNITPTPVQAEQLSALARRFGKSTSEVLDEFLAYAIADRSVSTEFQGRRTAASLRDRLACEGILGSFAGPGDLTSNPKYMEGFGSSKRVSDQIQTGMDVPDDSIPSA